MALQGTVTTATEQTVGGASGVPTNGISQIIVDGAFTQGSIRLEIQNPQGSGWLTKPIWNCTYADILPRVGIIRTPDVGVSYRVIAEGIVGTAHVYFGA